jgi:hypothetical protein
MMPAFSVRRSYLLQSGLQEYLLARDAEEGVAGVHSAGAASGVASERTWFRRSRR